jgi:KaiC/GvpD/RAD55 family RecA-like ATPase
MSDKQDANDLAAQGPEVLTAALDKELAAAPNLAQAPAGPRPLAALLKDPALLNPPPRISSTFETIDKALKGGFMPGAMYVLAALTGRGKSTLCANLARRIAQGAPVLWFTLEDEDLASARKLVAQESNVALLALENYQRPGAVTPAEAGRVDAAKQKLEPLPLNIDTTTSDLAQVERLVVAYAARGVRVVLIDQSSWLHIPNCESRFQEASDIARRLKILAKSLKIVLFVLVQVNRQGAATVRDGQDLELFHIRDSGKWEEDSDAVLIMQGIEDAGNGDSLLKLDLKKHRHGKTGLRVFLKARLACGLVEDSPEHLEPEDLSKPKTDAEDEKTAWTDERFINACCAATPETKDAIFARAEDNELTERKAERLLKRAVALKKLFAYPRKGGEAKTFATLEPPPSKPTEAKPKRPPGRPKEINKGQAHTPPTPPTDGAQQAPVGGECLLRVQPAEGLNQ